MNILIIRLSSLGDIVLTQPVVLVLREHYPDAKIHFITKKVFVPLVDTLGCIDTIHIWEEYKSLSKLIKLGKNHFELVIDLHNKFNTFLIKTLVNGKRTITYNKKHNLRKKIVNHVTNESIKSTVDLYFSVLRKLEIQTELTAPRLHPNSKVVIKKEFGKHLIGIFPGALHKTKQYPIEQMAEVIKGLDENYQIVLLGSLSENGLVEKLIKLSKPDLKNLCGKLSISELISLIDQLDLVISNDSGPMHIAAALHKPQIAIFGATHPNLGFAPLNDKAITLSANLVCQPCSLHGSKKCPLEHFNCMRFISADQILNSLKAILN